MALKGNDKMDSSKTEQTNFQKEVLAIFSDSVYYKLKKASILKASLKEL